MAPKKKKAVVKTTRKVVQETVEVAVVDDDEDIIQVAGNEFEREEIIDSRRPFQEPVKTIIVEDKYPDTVQKARAQDDSETQTAEKEPEKKPEQREQTDAQETEEGTEDQAEEPPEKEKEKKKEKTGLQKEKKEEKTGLHKPRKRRGERARREEYKIYVFRVLKQVHPGMGISSKAMTVLNNLMTDMFERLADEATRLSKYSGKTTMSSREIQGAVKLVLPGDLGKHAIAEGAKAMSTFVSYDTNKS